MDIIRFAASRGSARFCIGTSMAAVALCALATPAFAQDAAKSSKTSETNCVAGEGSADANCTSVDTRGFGNVEILVVVGARGDTWDGKWQGVFGDPGLVSAHGSMTLSMPALAVRVYRRAP